MCVVDRIVFGVPRDLSVRDSFNTKKRKKRGARKCLRLSYYSSIFRSKEEKTRGAKVFAPLLLFLYIPIEGGKNEGRESVCASLTIPLYSEGKNQTRFVWVSGALMRGGLKRIRPIEIDFFPASA